MEEPSLPRKLNLACGRDVRPGWHNIDIAELEGVEVVDLFRLPWKLPSEHYEVVEARHFLEHIPHAMEGGTRDGFIRVMEEIHRILKPGGELHVIAPDWRHELACHSDPTHTRVLTPRTWPYFSGGGGLSYYSTARFELLEHHVSGRDARWHDKLRMGPSRMGLTVHVCKRIPGMDRILARPSEHTYRLRKL